jgi:probable selenium-dependent hydroxylase accessory protein YqeC
MRLKDLVGLRKGDVVAIVGAGGKSTLMYSLAQELRYESKVLVTTTTKIYMPEKECYDFIIIGEDDFNRCSRESGIYLHGKSVNDENKVIGLSENVIEGEIPYFDYILIEADGSKRKPIKGWNDMEPVVISKTQKTIGVISIEVIGKEINENNVHRVEKFIDITNSKKNELITIEHLASLIFHSKGLFKDSKGEKILFINKVEGQKEIALAYKLLNCIEEKNQNYIDKIIIGSLKSKEYEVKLGSD